MIYFYTMKIFLDDRINPYDIFQRDMDFDYYNNDWTIVRTYDDFINLIENNDNINIISFDHDLTNDHYRQESNINYDNMTDKCGYHCLKYFLENKFNPNTKLKIHSFNPEGKMNMKNLINEHKH